MSKVFPETHVYLAEYRCHHCGKLPPRFYPEDDEISYEYLMLFRCFEAIREKYGNPIVISRGYSCSDYQLELYKLGKSPTPYSVHIFGLALDLFPFEDKLMRIVEIARSLAPKPRIGWRLYQGNARPHVHIDLGWMITPIWSEDLKPGVEW